MASRSQTAHRDVRAACRPGLLAGLVACLGGTPSVMCTSSVLMAQLATPPTSVPSQVSALPLIAGLGSHRYAITTRSPLAQRYFEQGLRLGWAWELQAAARAFAEAERLDPRCAMCAWGTAWTLGYSPPATGSGGGNATELASARQAIARATQNARFVSPREAALIAATAERFVPGRSREASDLAYAKAIAHAAGRFPDDDDLRTLHAESLIPFESGQSWLPEIEAAAINPTALALVLTVLSRSPSHPGACRLLVELTLPQWSPEAVTCAERVAVEMPAAGHLLHLAAQVYVRSGRYADAVRVGQAAIDADRIWLDASDGGAGAQHTEARHVQHWLALNFAATMSGRQALAMAAAEEARRRAPALVKSEWHERARAALITTRATFGQWHEVLDEPMPSTARPLARGLAHYARGVAYAALDQAGQAQRELENLRSLQRTLLHDDVRASLRIAASALAGEIALRRGQVGSAVIEFERAVAEQDAGPSSVSSLDAHAPHQPTLWHYPLRHSLGQALLHAGRAVEAARVYTEDLQRYPENGWSLLGLAQALDAQGNQREADRVRERLAIAFANADITPRGSRF